jgi:hypothetical protein
MTTTETQETKDTNVDFWDCDAGCERLSWTTITEAVEAWADDQHPTPLPETVTVYGFARLEAGPDYADGVARRALETVMEALDEDFGDPDEATEPTDAMRAAARQFVDAVISEYAVWRCDEVTSVTVRVADHVPADWMAAKVAL